MERFAALLASLLSQGVSLEAALAHLKVEGATPIEAIKAIAQVQAVSAGEAKRLFSQSPAWAKEVAAGDALHRQVIALLEKERKS
jgi:hypothetical protein